MLKCVRLLLFNMTEITTTAALTTPAVITVEPMTTPEMTTALTSQQTSPEVQATGSFVTFDILEPCAKGALSQ